MFRFVESTVSHALAISALTAIAAMTGCARPSAAPLRLAFAAADVGTLPAGWTPMVTNGATSATEWQITKDGVGVDEHALSLVRNDNGRAQFNLCVHDGIELADVDLSAWCKGDWGVGIVWRCRDADNYYVCRVNPAEGNVNLYKVVGGLRSKLGSATLHRFIDGQWYHLRARMAQDEIICGAEGCPPITVRDASLPDAGRIGVWTRADALGSFGRIEITEYKEPTRRDGDRCAAGGS